MNFWWVNHRQTFKYENSGNYIWSPKKNSNGGNNHFYNNMTLARSGDYIISYADQQIKAIGVITEDAIEGHKPEEFSVVGENWEQIGWYIPVMWNNLDSPIRVKDIFIEISHLFPEKYSPINPEGNGNQVCYLAEISFDLYKEIYQRSKDLNNDFSFLHQIKKQLVEKKELKNINETCRSETEKQQLILARKGQGEFRRKIIRQERRCRITGLDNPKLLIASHIKPWRYSDNTERLDKFNGFLLSPHIDRLFDGNLISFSNNGDLLIYSDEARQALTQWGIDPVMNVGRFTIEQQQYLDFHRDLCQR